jgi:hypothetical protein
MALQSSNPSAPPNTWCGGPGVMWAGGVKLVEDGEEVGAVAAVGAVDALGVG